MVNVQFDKCSECGRPKDYVRFGKDDKPILSCKYNHYSAPKPHCVFTYPDGSTTKCKLGSIIKGIRKGLHRPIKVTFVDINKNDLSMQEFIYTCTIALHGSKGEVEYV